VTRTARLLGWKHVYKDVRVHVKGWEAYRQGGAWGHALTVNTQEGKRELFVEQPPGCSFTDRALYLENVGGPELTKVKEWVYSEEVGRWVKKEEVGL
jgi:hypothetical protein